MRLRTEKEIRISDFGVRNNSAHSAFRNPHSAIPRGITLIEVLISMFVLLFGLMGVAAIFPVASHYILEGDKRDRSSGLAQVAFEELKARKYLRPTQWIYPTNTNATNPGSPVIGPPNAGPLTNYFGSLFDPGVAFVLDPLLSAIPITGPDQTLRSCFPAKANNNSNNAPSGWPTLRYPANPPNIPSAMPMGSWPIKRVTLDVNPHLVNNTVMSSQTAETGFRLRDDLSVVQPDAGDRPSIQRWQTSGGQLLSRDYTGDYSWLATVVPTSSRALLGLQPAANIKDAFYEVTTVVFYKRDIVPLTSTEGSPGSERLIGAEFLNETELAIFDHNTSSTHPETVNTALDGIKPGNWIAVMGVNQITGAFMMKWYKVQAMDDENTQIVSMNTGSMANGLIGRYLMVQGPDWPSASYNNLRVAILPGAIDAYTRVMQVDVE